MKELFKIVGGLAIGFILATLIPLIAGFLAYVLVGAAFTWSLW